MKNTLQIYDSFEEMENNKIAYFATLEPKIALFQLKDLILSVYGLKEDPLLKSMPHIIHFNTKE